MTDIFREVDEELRQEQAKKLWQRYGRYVIAAAVVLVVGVGGYQAWQAWDLQHRTELSERYAAALDLVGTGDTAAADQALTEIVGEGGGYGTLAAFTQARLRAEAGDSTGAAELWDRIADSEGEGSALRQIAILLSVMHRMEQDDPAELEARLAPLTEVGQAFRPSALELSAAIALRQGDKARAREIYAGIVDDLAAPPGLRARAAQMLQALEE